MSDQTPGCGSTTDAAKRLREQSAPVVAERGGVETAAVRATQVVYGVLADHPMWIGDDGEPLDYSPTRENRIADFLNEIEPLLADALASARREGAAEVVDRVEVELGDLRAEVRSGQAPSPLVAAALEGVKRRLSWPSMHWGTERVHADAWVHIAAAACTGVETRLRAALAGPTGGA